MHPCLTVMSMFFFVRCCWHDRDMYKRSRSFRVLTHCLQQYWTPRDNSVFIKGQKVSITKSTWKEHGLGYKMYFSLHQPFSYCHKSSTAPKDTLCILWDTSAVDCMKTGWSIRLEKLLKKKPLHKVTKRINQSAYSPVKNYLPPSCLRLVFLYFCPS